MNRKYLISLLLVFVLVVVGACGKDDSKNANSEEPKGEIELQNPDGELELDLPEPDLTGIPDVVAEVNGTEIFKKDFETHFVNEFTSAAYRAEMVGEEIDQDDFKLKIAEGLIRQELLIQAADNAGFKASEEAINDTLVELTELNELDTVEDFFAAWAENDVTEEEIRLQVSIQVKVDQLIEHEVGDIDTSDTALKAVYDDIKSQQDEAGLENFPTFEEAREELVDLVISQKEGETIQALMEKYREEADVTIFL